ncbi:MAG: hypothetical protein JNK05_28505 [Myxococcales bacterium]|nr:hypothetical protein [Myxococcales bacterium]
MSITAIRTWLLDPTSAWLAGAIVVLAPIAIVLAAWFSRRDRRVAWGSAVAAMALVVALVARFALLSIAGTPVVATLTRQGDNQGSFIEIEGTYRDERGRVVTLRDAQPLVHVWFARGSSAPNVSFVVLRAWPTLCEHGSRARLPQWRAALVALVVAGFVAMQRRRARDG